MKTANVNEVTNEMKKLSTKGDPTQEIVVPNERHQFLVSGHRFDIDKYYKPMKAVGSGAYGVVCTATDTRTNKKVAIKKCTNAFDDIIDGKRILREMKLLSFFKNENVINIFNAVGAKDTKDLSDFNDVYMVLECMEADLHKIIYSKNKLSNDHLAYFVYQIFCGLKYLHSCGIIHRDLKPSNLLVNSNCDLKICDFGLARGLDWDQSQLTEYVVTRWYRAPEVMCSAQEYDEKIDVWSAGTILAEMIIKKPIFPGEHYIDQLNQIFDFIGTPVEANGDFECITNDKALKYVKKLKPKSCTDYNKYFKNFLNSGKINNDGITLLQNILIFNPKKRWSVDQAIQHKWFEKLFDANKVAKIKETREINFDFDYKVGTRDRLKRVMSDTCEDIRKADALNFQTTKEN